MLARKFFIPLRHEYLSLRRDSRLYQLVSLHVLAKKTNINSPTRFAIIVSKKVAPLSVSRHKIKRTIVRACELLNKKISFGWDIALIAQRGIENKNAEDIFKMLSNLNLE